MPKVHEVCRHVRSKVAGPFWVTMDLMFDSQENYERYAECPALSAEAVAKLYDLDPAAVRLYPIPQLKVLKISYPRKCPQGSIEERDLHSGQQYVRIYYQELEEESPVG